MDKVTLYHASPIRNIDRFQPFSHFGSETAAAARAAQRRGKHTGAMWLYRVEMDTTGARTLEDAGDGSHSYGYAMHDSCTLTRLLVEAGLADQGLFKETMDARQARGEEGALELLARTLRGKGVDVLCYENLYEDPDSLSYIAVDPARVRIVGVERLQEWWSPSFSYLGRDEHGGCVVLTHATFCSPAPLLELFQGRHELPLREAGSSSGIACWMESVCDTIDGPLTFVFHRPPMPAEEAKAVRLENGVLRPWHLPYMPGPAVHLGELTTPDRIADAFASLGGGAVAEEEEEMEENPGP